MTIKNIRRFFCPKCGYITEDPNRIDFIEKHGGICPS